MTAYTQIIDHRTVTTDSLGSDREACRAIDQARELVAGSETWGIVYDGGQRGQMSRYPNGRGTIATGGDSAWGDWIDVGRDGNKAEILALDDGEHWHDDNGEPVCQHGFSLRPDAHRDCDCSAD